MSRTLRYLLLTLALIAIGIWLVTVYRSCEAAKQQEANQQIEGDKIVDTYGDEDTTDIYAEDFPEDDVVSDDGTEDDSTETNNETDNPQEGGTLDDYDGPANGGDGEYLVVAGAYISKRNAVKTRDRLTKEGYNAEIRVFLASDYHSVILGNYDTAGEAFRVARDLRKHTDTKDAYAHKKRYRKKR